MKMKKHSYMKDRTSGEKNTLNDRISEGANSGRLWALSNELIKQRSTGEDYKHSCEAPTLQDTEAKPILFGGDVVGLYPNMDPISVAQITADAVRKTRVKFKGINVQLLAVYLVLVLGQSELCKRGLGDIVPRRKHKSNSTSLAGTLNRDLGNWDFTGIEFTYEKVVEMIASMVQTSVLVMTTTTCYKFAGRIYRQRYGLGIGLRGSAALARLCMCYWDKLWGKLMLDNGLSLELFSRYVDDLRIYLRPIRKCWTWMNNKWVFNEKECTKGDHQWTMEQLRESMNGIWTFLEFTVEGEQDFSDSWLPTLDFKTQVAHYGTIKYLFYSKPMASNIVLEKGTALSKGTVFSSLRQELVRRLLNTDISLGPETRVNLTCDFIQNMVNSNHKFPYIKSVTLQALTKFNHMVQRSKCTPDQKRYAPLHRTRDHNEEWRKLAKYTNGALWYTGEKLVDKFANSWKSWIKRKKGPYSQRKKLNKKGRLFHSTFGGGGGTTTGNIGNKKKKITSVLFVPKTSGGKLVDLINEEQDAQEQEIDWRMLVLEKPGTPLVSRFIKKFPMVEGCERGLGCSICDNKGIKCTPKRIVYKAVCQKCINMGGTGDKDVLNETGDVMDKVVGDKTIEITRNACYVG